MKSLINKRIKGSVKWFLPFCFFTFLPFTSCSESDDETADEYANWQQRNEAFFATLEDSLTRGGTAWKKIKTFTKDEQTAGVNTDYIYAKVLEESGSEGSPIYTDSVRVAYRGRLIPSATYTEGLVFDQTYIGDYSRQTTSVLDSQVSGLTDGFATAMLHMHKGDRWRIYVPYQLGYGTAGSGSIPAYSTLIFDVVLIDYITNSEPFTPWSSRRADRQP
jgi:FKBP-type peptidyl-prolyl cis-trans isomerase FklB